VIGTHDWYGSVYIASMPKPYHTDGHPDSIDLKEAEDFGEAIVNRSRKISGGDTTLILPTPKAPQEMPPPPMKSGEPSMGDKMFASELKYHKETCKYPTCRLCMDNCPMDGIDLSITPPVIAKPCINCEFCTKICPTGALDGSSYNEFAGPIAARDVKGFLMTDLIKAEEEGRFRRLVPVDEVGSGSPLYKSHTKHPQWIIGKGLH
jgi:ferredoxin